MKKESNSSPSSPPSAPSKLKIAGIVTVVLLVIFSAFTVYYYVNTPAATVLVVTADFPKDLSTNFTSDTLTNHVVANLQKICSKLNPRIWVR